MTVKEEYKRYRAFVRKTKKLHHWGQLSKPTHKKKKHKKKKPGYNKTMDEMAQSLKGKSYQDFLESEYWGIVRSMVMKRDGYKCIICKSTKRLQVHHDTYRNHFKEHRNLKDLMVLCRDCHYEHHCAQD